MNAEKKLIAPIIITVLLLFPMCASRQTPPIIGKGDHVCISLKNMLEFISRKSASSGGIPKEILSCGNISWLEGYVVDRENSDIIIFGRRKEKRPAYNLTCLIDDYKSVLSNAGDPYCSLDPQPENIIAFNNILNSKQYHAGDLDMKASLLSDAIGGQQTVIGGIPRHSLFAFTMIDADYHMKKVSQGLIELPGIISCLQLRMNKVRNKSGSGPVKTAPTMSRFWFHIKKSTHAKQYPSFLKSDDIVTIAECPVVLLTEKQMADKNGNLRDVNATDHIANVFTQRMTEHFSTLTDTVPVYAELENLFRLHALLKALRYNSEHVEVCRTIDRMMEKTSYTTNNSLPQSLPGLVNLKETTSETTTGKTITTTIHSFMVAGGVGMDLAVRKGSMRSEKKLEHFQNKVITLRPKRDIFLWIVEG